MSFFMGLVFCAAALVVIVLGGGSAAELLDYKALLFVLIGMAGLILITSPMAMFRRNVGCALKTLRRGEKTEGTIQTIMSLVQTARREGILALEGCEEQVKNPILKKGLALITGSADRETIESILGSDARSLSGVEKSAQEFVERIAVMSPGIGMIGTLVEIIQMLYTYKGPQMLAPGIAEAILPVVYSGIIAYLLLMPLAARIQSGSERQSAQRELAIQGVLAIQSGELPHIVEQRLSRFVQGEQAKNARENAQGQ